MEIKFNNREELEMYLTYLERFEVDGVYNFYHRKNFKEIFLDELLDSGFVDILSLEDNEHISKIVWKMWVEKEGEESLNFWYEYADDYNRWGKYTQYFQECFNINSGEIGGNI